MTAAGLARRHPGVNGYVRNLPDGDVELVAEGEATDVDAFLREVAAAMAGYIRHTAVREESCAGFQGFRIRHY